jgi:hypothetical protein
MRPHALTERRRKVFRMVIPRSQLPTVLEGLRTPLMARLYRPCIRSAGNVPTA